MYTFNRIDYEPSLSDSEDLRHSLLYLKVLEQLKEVRRHLDLSLPAVGVFLAKRSDIVLVCSDISPLARNVVTMNDTDTLIESIAEHLLKGK